VRLTGEAAEPPAREQEPPAQLQQPERPPREHGEGRGRRRRGRRGERHEQRTEQTPDVKDGTSVEPVAPEPVDAALTTPAPAVDACVAPPAAVIFPAVEPAQSEAASARQLEQAAEVAVLEQAAPPVPAARPGATPEAVLATLQANWPADLVQVETDPGKVQALPELEDILGLRAGRTRPALMPLSDEPLIQVETRKRESPPDDSRRTPEVNPV
jgi:ribonuclease E